MLFFLLELQDTSDYKIIAPTDEIQLVEEMCSSQTTETGCCEEFCALTKLVMEDKGIEYPHCRKSPISLHETYNEHWKSTLIHTHLIQETETTNGWF